MYKKGEDGYSVKDLLLHCPYCEGNPKVCQFYDLRKLSVRERLLWGEYLSEEVCETIREKHLNCEIRKANLADSESAS